MLCRTKYCRRCKDAAFTICVGAHKGAAKDSSIVGVRGRSSIAAYIGGARRNDTQQRTHEWPGQLSSIQVKQCETALGACVHGLWADDGMLSNERRDTYRWRTAGYRLRNSVRGTKLAVTAWHSKRSRQLRLQDEAMTAVEVGACRWAIIWK